MQIVETFFFYLLIDYLTFILSIILVVTLWRALNAIEIITVYTKQMLAKTKEKQEVRRTSVLDVFNFIF